MRSCLRAASLCVVSLLGILSLFVLSAPVARVRADIEHTGVLPGETFSTNPKPRTGIVTATVSDTTPPSVPILVYPENNSMLSVNVFPFIWKESIDDRAVVKYQLYLDGTLLFDDISPQASETTAYLHTTTNGVSSLTPKQPIADGLHTWKIIAFDRDGNNASSTTWSFTIDTNAPAIVVTKIGALVVSISSQDESTIPTKPLILYANTPIIIGSTESNAKVQLSFTLPGQGLITLNTVAASDGSFTFTLPSLPHDVVIYLTFVARDAAGNTATINQVPIMIKTKTVVVPPPFDQIIPPIPIPERTEIIQQTQQIIEQVIPPTIVQQASGLADTVSPIANSLLGLLIPLLRLAIALHFTGVGISFLTMQLFRKAARALYLLPPEERLGLVFDVDTHKGVPYALVKIFPVKQENALNVELSREVKEFVTDADGLYGPVSLSPGQYTLEVTQADYSYVARQSISRNPDDETLYSGEIFVTDDAHRHLYFMVPMRSNARLVERGAVAAENQEKRGILGLLARRSAIGFARLPTWILVVATVFMGLIAIFYFTVWNVVMFLLYLYTISKRAVRRVRLPTLVGGVVDQFGDPMSLAYVRVVPKDNTRLEGVSMEADELGRFTFALNPGVYELQASWFDGSATEWIEIELKKTATAVALSIQSGTGSGANALPPAALPAENLASTG